MAVARLFVSFDMTMAQRCSGISMVLDRSSIAMLVLWLPPKHLACNQTNKIWLELIKSDITLLGRTLFFFFRKAIPEYKH